MSFNDNVKVTPSQFVAGNIDSQAEQDAKALQTQKWWVLGITFLVVLVVGMIWVWTRSPVYQSQAIIHFSYGQQVNSEQAAVPTEQITLNNQRLTSNRVIEALSLRLLNQSYLSIEPEALAAMLSTEENLNSRIVSLYASGEEPAVLKPVLEQWISLYLDQLTQETVSNTEETISEGQEQLVALEAKIAEQRRVIEQYSEENNIISLERDENRVLAKIKGMGAALDEAETMQAEAEAELDSVRQSINRGETVIHPEDQRRMDGLYSSITEIESQLALLGQDYTEAYMDLDPAIVGQKRKLAGLQERYDEAELASQQRYLEALQRTVSTSQQKQAQLQSDLDTLGKDAQVFNQKLEEYGRMMNSLEQLQLQFQTLQDQLIQTEVQNPYQPKITVLEQPFEPGYPVSPNYWRDSAIVLGVAALAGVCALLLFSFIHRQRTPPATMTSYHVVPNAGMTLEHQRAMQEGLAHQQNAQLGHSKTPLQLGQQSAEPLRLLSEQDCQALFKASNRDGKLVVGLLLCGVAPAELLLLRYQDVDVQAGTLTVAGDYGRILRLHADCLILLNKGAATADDGALIFSERLDTSQLDQLVVNIAHDAGLPFPDQFPVAAIRHTYLTYLVKQGARLNDIEQVAGFVSPVTLSVYRQVNRNGNTLDVSQLETRFPLV